MKYLLERLEFIKENFWGDSASGVLPIAKDTGRILIGLRSGSVNEPYTWGNFGGAIGLNDYGEEDVKLSPEDNAIQEMREEIDYHGEIELIESYVFKKRGFVYYNFLGLIPNESDIDDYELNWEVDEIKWVTFDELVEHEDLHFGLQGLIDNAYEQIKNLTE